MSPSLTSAHAPPVTTPGVSAAGPVGADDSPDLSAMLLAIGTGDLTEFANLYAATSARIYGLVLRVLRCPDQSAEVTQEVYIQVWRQASRYDPARGRSFSWIAVMAHRRAVDRVRTVRAATVRDDDFAVHNAAQEFDQVWADVSRRSEAATVRTALEHLSDRQRQALVLTYFGGHTAATAASLLNVPVGTVKTRIRDGMINLRRVLVPA